MIKIGGGYASRIWSLLASRDGLDEATVALGLPAPVLLLFLCPAVDAGTCAGGCRTIPAFCGSAYLGDFPSLSRQFLLNGNAVVSLPDNHAIPDGCFAGILSPSQRAPLFLIPQIPPAFLSRPLIGQKRECYPFIFIIEYCP